MLSLRHYFASKCYILHNSVLIPLLILFLPPGLINILMIPKPIINHLLTRATYKHQSSLLSQTSLPYKFPFLSLSSNETTKEVSQISFLTNKVLLPNEVPGLMLLRELFPGYSLFLSANY